MLPGKFFDMRRIVSMAAAVALGCAPVLAVAAPGQTPQSPPGPAASIPDTTVNEAGAALHDVAKLQQKYQGQFEAASPEQKQGLSQKANAGAVQAIQSHGLSIEEYSNVMRTAQNNPQLKQRVLDAAGKTN